MVERGNIIQRSHGLLPPDIRPQLPDLYSGEEHSLESKALVKFFAPDASWSRFASEFDGENIFLGLVSGFEVEVEYFSFSEMLCVRGSYGLAFERDLQFEPKALMALMEDHQG
jgi:hypothetical protein